MNKTTIIIPSYDTKENAELVKRLINSLGDISCKIIVEKNKSGLTISLNNAVKKSNPKHDLIFFSDDMVIKDKNWFEKIKEVAYSDDKIGAVTSRTTFRKTIRNKIDGSEFEYDFCGFNLCYVKREVIDKLFPLDENFYFYFWEDDFSIKLKNLGYKVGAVDIQFEHDCETTVNKFKHFKRQVHLNSWKHFCVKHGFNQSPDEIIEKVLVTGSKGFIGKHVCEKLEKEGYKVYEFDLPEYNLKDCDFKYFEDNKIDYVIHCAAVTGLENCATHPIRTIETNVLGTTKLLDACYYGKVKKFIHISTWAADNEKATYDVSKNCAEKIVKLYNNLYNVESVIVRIGTTYGKGMKDIGVIKSFLTHKKNKTNPTVYGDGTQWRQFTYIKDTVNGIIQCLKRGFPGETYYILSEEKTSINDLLNALELKAEYKEKQSFDVEPVVVKNSEGRFLRWKPEFDIKKGISDMLENE